MEDFFIRLVDPDDHVIFQGLCYSSAQIRKICLNFHRHYREFKVYVYEFVQEVIYDGSSR